MKGYYHKKLGMVKGEPPKVKTKSKKRDTTKKEPVKQDSPNVNGTSEPADSE